MKVTHHQNKNIPKSLVGRVMGLGIMSEYAFSAEQLDILSAWVRNPPKPQLN